MEGLRIEASDSLVEMESRLRSLCCSTISHWSNLKSDAKFYMEPLLGGITNTLFRCWTKDGFTVVVRIFGDSTDSVISRDEESEVTRLLAERGFGKKVFAEFSNGRIEEWISGRSVTLDEMRSDPISLAIARRLAVLHKQKVHSKNLNLERVSFWEKIKGYAKKASQVRFDHDSAKQLQLNRIDLPKRIAELVRTRAFLLQKCPSAIVFSHNDLLNGNIVCDDSEAAEHFIQFIDFEYASYNHQAFDIANHFCEHCGFECDWNLFPRQELQHAFARAYLTEFTGGEASNHDAESFVKNMLPWVLASHLFWGFWAVIQASASTIDFDYLNYAQRRFDGFDYHSENLQKELSLSTEEHKIRNCSL